uniref:Uncharacterized protein n=1 Tax=Trichogramma kaykai TaxID=54128 RepID=A0ABD2VWL7_9HYME
MSASEENRFDNRNVNLRHECDYSGKILLTKESWSVWNLCKHTHSEEEGSDRRPIINEAPGWIRRGAPRHCLYDKDTLSVCIPLLLRLEWRIIVAN